MASAALFFVSFLVFAIAGQGLSGHIINLFGNEKIVLQGNYTFPSDNSHLRFRGRKAAIFGAAIAAIMGESGKSLVFHVDQDDKVYFLRIDTRLATNKLIYPDNMYFPDAGSIFHD